MACLRPRRRRCPSGKSVWIGGGKCRFLDELLGGLVLMIGENAGIYDTT